MPRKPGLAAGLIWPAAVPCGVAAMACSRLAAQAFPLVKITGATTMENSSSTASNVNFLFMVILPDVDHVGRNRCRPLCSSRMNEVHPPSKSVC
jgi:hypothetical protein